MLPRWICDSDPRKMIKKLLEGLRNPKAWNPPSVLAPTQVRTSTDSMVAREQSGTEPTTFEDGRMVLTKVEVAELDEDHEDAEARGNVYREGHR